MKDNPHGLDFNEISITGEILFAILYDDLYAFQDKINPKLKIKGKKFSHAIPIELEFEGNGRTQDIF